PSLRKTRLGHCGRRPKRGIFRSFQVVIPSGRTRFHNEWFFANECNFKMKEPCSIQCYEIILYFRTGRTSSLVTVQTQSPVFKGGGRQAMTCAVQLDNFTTSGQGFLAAFGLL